MEGLLYIIGVALAWIVIAVAIIHVIMDMVTVYTVNHTGTIPLWINNLAHIIFYLSAIMYSYMMCLYTLNLTRPQQMNRVKRLLALLPVMIYVVLLCTPLLTSREAMRRVSGSTALRMPNCRLTTGGL